MSMPTDGTAGRSPAMQEGTPTGGLAQAVIDLYDRFTHSTMDRRAFLDRLALLTGSGTAAAAALAALEPQAALAQTIAPDDPRIGVTAVTIPGALGPVRAVFARPRQGSGTGPVIVVHENRGLNAHIEDVARVFATRGVPALAVDFLSRRGGTPADPDRAREMIGTLPPAEFQGIAAQAAAWLRAEGAARVGVVGFCWGGAVVHRLATAGGFDAGVVYYGVAVVAEAGRLAMPLLIHLAERDDRVNATHVGFEEAARASGRPVVLHVYPGTQHAFNNDTSRERHDPAAAALAMERTVAFFREHLPLEARPGG